MISLTACCLCVVRPLDERLRVVDGDDYDENQISVKHSAIHYSLYLYNKADVAVDGVCCCCDDLGKKARKILLI